MNHRVAVSADYGKVGKRYFLARFRGFTKLLFVMNVGVVAANFAVSLQEIELAPGHLTN
jgi:hypothetical protein